MWITKNFKKRVCGFWEKRLVLVLIKVKERDALIKNKESDEEDFNEDILAVWREKEDKSHNKIKLIK